MFSNHKIKYEPLTNILLAKAIDHTLLKPEATSDEIKILCSEAKQFQFASVCINPCFVELCSEQLAGSLVKTCTVIGFPLGANASKIKRKEAEAAIEAGAQEVDMVINIGHLKSKSYDYLFEDIREVAIAAKEKNVLSKVIIETALLSDEEKIKACFISKKAGADFVKTSTGFSKGGATIQDVALMKFVAGDPMGVKASGGIRSRADAISMLMNGADRIGTSSGLKILNDL
ncbi:MAG: deoxyribose-phosphate aldolase [Ignavibacteriaceae bacterium]